jgi:hypothetical protein
MVLSNLLKGMIAGLVATIVLSMLMAMKSKMGLMPELDIIAMLTRMAGSSTPATGWLLHFGIGTVMWGGLFALFSSKLPGQSLLMMGVVFGVGAWLLMMIMVMPMAGAGLFGMKFGMMAPVMTLMLHMIFGAVLGGVYAIERPLGAAGQLP